MPLALLVIGSIFLVAAVRGKQDLLFDTLKDDFMGPGNFFYWALSVWAVTSLGYFKPLRPLSHAFLLLVFLSLFISHKGFFDKFMEQIQP